MQKIVITVSTDIYTDQRVQKIAHTCVSSGFNVLVIGRIKSNSRDFSAPYDFIRLQTFAEKGFLFYALFNIRLFFKLLFLKTDLIYANDLDTLLPAFLATCLKGNALVYDSHEYFTGVPELKNKPWVRKIWSKLESILLPKIQHKITVTSAVAKKYKSIGGSFEIVRNFPLLLKEYPKLRRQYPDVILYQGALNVDRGIEEVILAMEYLPNCVLWLAGEGDLSQTLRRSIIQLPWRERICFLGLLSPRELKEITLQASIGLSIEKTEIENYKVALPNKIFDYMQASLPMLVSKMDEVMAIWEDCPMGIVIENYEPIYLAKCVRELLQNQEQYAIFQEKCSLAREVFQWEKEAIILMKTLQLALKSANKLD